MSEMIAGRYMVVKHIGQGGMADVYVALDTLLNREVAIKVLRGELSSDPVALLRFQREAHASTALSHPNIVDIYDVGEEHGRHYIVMEYVRGKTLKQLVNQRGALTKEEAVNIMKQLCSAIIEAHKRGIIHRDIKPQNVLVKDDGTIKVVDFGIALAQDALQLTQSDSVMGSVHYLAPELARGEQATNQSDIYALGIVFFELVTGEVPFHADSAVQVALQHMRNEIPSVREYNPTLPQALDNVIIKATAKNKQNRYHNVQEMLSDLSMCLSASRANDKRITFNNYVDENKTMVIKQVEDLDNDKPSVSNNQETIVEKKQVASNAPRKVKKQKKSIIPYIITALLICLSVGVIYLIISLSGILEPTNKAVEVPNIIGMNVTSAKQACTDVNLNLDTANISYELTDNVEKGNIISCNPSVGSSVVKGERINVVVSSGIGAYMRNYVGMSIKSAKEDLAKYTNMRIIEQATSDESVTPGVIIRQELLTEGTQFNPETNTEVRLVYAAYPTIIIPLEIENMSVDDAKAYLETLGADVLVSNLDTADMTEEEIANLNTGVVVRSQPAFGQSYTQEEGTFVTLYYY